MSREARSLAVILLAASAGVGAFLVPAIWPAPVQAPRPPRPDASCWIDSRDMDLLRSGARVRLVVDVEAVRCGSFSVTWDGKTLASGLGFFPARMDGHANIGGFLVGIDRHLADMRRAARGGSLVIRAVPDAPHPPGARIVSIRARFEKAD